MVENVDNGNKLTNQTTYEDFRSPQKNWNASARWFIDR